MSDIDAEISQRLLQIVDEAPTVTPDEVLDPQSHGASLRAAPRRPRRGPHSAVLRVAVAAFVLAALSGVLLLALGPARPAPTAPSMPRGTLTAVSCIAHDLCVGVGSRAETGAGATLAAVWNGDDWTPQPTPNLSGSDLPNFSDISCASRSSCVAVGSTATTTAAGTRTQPLAMSWNGRSWTIDTPAGLGPPPSAHNVIDSLEGVSCPTSTFCLAVGLDEVFDPKRFVQRSVVEALVGGRWRREPAPAKTLLSSVSCSSATACLAVGQPIGNSSGGGAVVERWNGHTWTDAGVPELDQLGPVFGQAVDCTAADDCVVILPRGSFGGAEALRWNGSDWSMEPLPALSADSEILQLAVGCAAPGSCVVLLSTVPFPPPDGASKLAISLSADVLRGALWAKAPVPAGTSSTSNLEGISCASGICMTAGSLDDLWDGSSWRVTYRGEESMSMQAIAASESIGVTKS